MYDIVCVLLDLHHWTLTELYATDIDLIMDYITYYPEWRRRVMGGAPGSSGGAAPKEVFADQLNF